MTIARWMIVVVAVVLAPGCRNQQPAADRRAADCAGSGAPAGDYLALVGNTPIREQDIVYQRMVQAHTPELTPEQRKKILGKLVDKELAARRAVELGLDRDHYYRERLSQLEARVAAFKRDTLSDALMAKELDAVQVDPAEARRYFDAHAAELRAEFHVWQIIERDPAAIERDRAALAAGKSFEEVAVESARRSAHPLVDDEGEAEEGGGALYDRVARKGAERADAKAGGPPKSFWDIGYLRWDQLPESWRPVVPGLRPGQVSEVIEDQGGRYFLVKLIERRDGPAPSFEAAEPSLVRELREQKVRQRRVELEAQLRAATPVRYRDPALAPAPPAKSK